MNQSQTDTLEVVQVPPKRGDTAEFTLREGGKLTGKVVSAYEHHGEPRVSILAGGKRYTRVATSVRVTRRAAAEPEVTRGPQRPGQPAPNAGKKYPAEPLTPAEASAILAQCSRRAPTGVRNRALLMLLSRSGLRISEALDLRPSDISMDNHTIRLLDTKSGKPQTRGFHPDAEDALARWLDTRKSLGVRNGRLFCTLDGGPLSDDYVRQMLRRYARRAGVEKRVHPHGLRHTFADQLQRGGMTVGEISKLLGHSSIAVTARYLDHMTNHEAISALEAIDLPSLDHPEGSGT